MDIQVLKQFQAKAGCRYTQQNAQRLWNQLKPQLNRRERGFLSIAWNHALRDEGREELDNICDAIEAYLTGKDVNTLRHEIVFLHDTTLQTIVTFKKVR